MAKTKNYSPEFRAEAAKMVVESSRAIASVARELHVSETSLGNWVRAYREDHAEDEPPLPGNQSRPLLIRGASVLVPGL